MRSDVNCHFSPFSDCSATLFKMIENDVVFSPVLTAEVAVDKGFRFGPYVAQNGDDEAIRNWMKSVSKVDNLTEANLKIVREGEEIFFEATKKIDAFEKFCLWSKLDDGQSEILAIPNPPDADSSLHLNTPKTNGQVHECNICHKLYATMRYLIAHKASHTNENPFKCTLCERTYRWEGSLKNHVAIIHLQKFKCRICNRALPTRRRLLDHEQIHSDKMPFHCEQCGAGYRSLSGFTRHVKKIHSTFKCGWCGKVWNSKELFKQHQETHKIDWQSSLQQIFDHQQQENKFECDICHNRFRLKSTLLSHRHSHTNDKPFECSICGLAFRRRDDLSRHAARVHSQRFKCHLCEDDYPTQKELTAHLATHLEEKPFHCDECNTTFTRKKELQRHQRVAHRRFECFCGKVWDSEESLEQHSKCHYMSVDSISGG